MARGAGDSVGDAVVGGWRVGCARIGRIPRWDLVTATRAVTGASAREMPNWGVQGREDVGYRPMLNIVFSSGGGHGDRGQDYLRSKLGRFAG